MSKGVNGRDATLERICGKGKACSGVPTCGTESVLFLHATGIRKKTDSGIIGEEKREMGVAKTNAFYED